MGALPGGPAALGVTAAGPFLQGRAGQGPGRYRLLP